jgi:hypothetical protein
MLSLCETQLCGFAEMETYACSTSRSKSSRSHVNFLEYTLLLLILAGDHYEQARRESDFKPTGLDTNGAPHKQRP